MPRGSRERTGIWCAWTEIVIDRQQSEFDLGNNGAGVVVVVVV
ncbi:MAG: hypothetical protein ACJA14_001203 [Ilumatobacter sp.]